MFKKQKEHHKTPEAKEPAAEGAAPETGEAVTPVPEATPEAETPAAAEAAAPQPAPEAAELAAVKDRYARLMADFDNFRKRQVREREDLIKRANEDLLGDLLPVVDHLELALAKTEGSTDPVIVGVKMVYDQFVALLGRYGLTPLDTKGEPFDPTYHEALSQMSSATVPANMIIDQFRRGWLLAGKLLRPAQVIVSSGQPDDAQCDAENASVSD